MRFMRSVEAARKIAASLLRPLVAAVLGVAFAAPVPLGAAYADPRFRTVYSFPVYSDPVGGPYGLFACSGLVADRRNGGIYGTLCQHGSQRIAGAVYRLDRPAAAADPWSQTILHTFKGSGDYGEPYGDLTVGPAGELYGTTQEGQIFMLRPPANPGGAWKETILFRPASYADGYQTFGNLIVDRSGAVYGVASYGGIGTCDCGLVFKLTPPVLAGAAWTREVLHTFSGPDGAFPGGRLIVIGNDLYGATGYGGPGFAGGYTGFGVLYRLRPPVTPGGVWTQTVIHSFDGGLNGAYPGDLIVTPTGELYGTTGSGGAGRYGGGTMFKLTQDAAGSAWTLTTLVSFGETTTDAFFPGGLFLDPSGALFGHTAYGGVYQSSGGTVFRLAPPATPGGSWTKTILYNFALGLDGGYPTGGLLRSKAGAIVGTTTVEGAFGFGTVYKITP